MWRTGTVLCRLHTDAGLVQAGPSAAGSCLEPANVCFWPGWGYVYAELSQRSWPVICLTSGDPVKILVMKLDHRPFGDPRLRSLLVPN